MNVGFVEGETDGVKVGSVLGVNVGAKDGAGEGKTGALSQT